MITPYRAKTLAEEIGYPMEEFMSEYIRSANRRIVETVNDARDLVAMAAREAGDNAELYSVWAVDLFRAAEIFKKHIRTARAIIDPPKYSKGSITEEGIARAKEYPVDQLVEFVRGKATAFCHQDKSPSLTYWAKGNRARCHVCGKSFNAIDILMERDGLGFVEAVKQLQ